jgi:hypothetical protein
MTRVFSVHAAAGERQRLPGNHSKEITDETS